MGFKTNTELEVHPQTHFFKKVNSKYLSCSFCAEVASFAAGNGRAGDLQAILHCFVFEATHHYFAVGVAAVAAVLEKKTNCPHCYLASVEIREVEALEEVSGWG